MLETESFPKILKYWLLLGCVLLFFQITIGGITRITGSGLSITKWEIVTGTLPPLNEKSWIEAFDLYKATPQYQKINKGMSMSDFKFIYFWEFFHRFWARMMGLIFIFPFIYFVFKSYFDSKLYKYIGAMFLCACMAAVFGWIMVASGLVDRPWVNAYKLSLHLSIALATLGFLLWATFYSFIKEKFVSTNRKLRRMTTSLFVLICVQIFFGAILSGTRAALVYPTWPEIGTNMVPHILLNIESWSLENLVNYDKSYFVPALIHFLHRTTGYIVFIYGLMWTYSVFRSSYYKQFKFSTNLLIIVLIFQVILGIITLLMSKGTIPVFFGVMHQATAIVLFGTSLYNVYMIRT